MGDNPENKAQENPTPEQQERDFSLDQSAAQLYRQLGGIDDSDHALASAPSALMQLLAQE